MRARFHGSTTRATATATRARIRRRQLSRRIGICCYFSSDHRHRRLERARDGRRRPQQVYLHKALLHTRTATVIIIMHRHVYQDDQVTHNCTVIVHWRIIVCVSVLCSMSAANNLYTIMMCATHALFIFLLLWTMNGIVESTVSHYLHSIRILIYRNMIIYSREINAITAVSLLINCNAQRSVST